MKPLLPAATMHTTIMKHPDTDQRIGAVIESNVPSMMANVRAFHDKFGLKRSNKPLKILDAEAIAIFRMQRLAEEFGEIREAFNNNQTLEFLDGLVDFVYVALGTADLMGWDFNEAWCRVHAANMKKVRASTSNPGRYSNSQDVVKPQGWTAPDLSDLV